MKLEQFFLTIEPQSQKKRYCSAQGDVIKVYILFSCHEGDLCEPCSFAGGNSSFMELHTSCLFLWVEVYVWWWGDSCCIFLSLACFSRVSHCRWTPPLSLPSPFQPQSTNRHSPGTRCHPYWDFEDYMGACLCCLKASLCGQMHAQTDKTAVP